MTTAQSESQVYRIVERNVQMLVDEFSIDLETAFEFVYKSRIFESLNSPETALRARSAAYIYEILREEYISQ